MANTNYTTLDEALKGTNSKFHWNAAEKTWCLSGTDRGNGWETDDFEAASKSEAENDALDYLNNY
ncbi:MAG TPA: hypothetical protein PKY60_16055 [Thermoflexales bacterium]|nr:hypothetical protein [Thermoflexales bacterium]